MKTNYNDCLIRLLKDEGGYSNDPDDDGGPTNFGVTLKDYRSYINKNGTALDVKNMTVDQAKRIYKSKYWDALNCDNLSSGVDYTCFDYGVNSGLGRPRKALSKFKSLSGIKLIDAINDERTGFLNSLAASNEHDRKFLKGWLARVSRVRDYSKALAKKDNTSGPIATATVATGAVLASQHHSVLDFFHAHPYTIVTVIAAVAVTVGLIVHFIRNNGK